MQISKRLNRLWQGYCKWGRGHPLLAVIIIFTAGIIFWGGFNTSMELTNNETFCISCHEMRNNVYKEYRKTIHYANRTGVRATCPDCHVPRDWGHKVVRKISATNELFHKIIGSVDTPEKFQAKRLQLAEYVWHTMKVTDSRECRNCHSFDYMALDKQQPASLKKHKRGRDEGLTCIDCHMGIAHQLPRDFDKDETLHNQFKKQKRPCSDCHKQMAQSFDW